jgi:CubicO group peptidase (beta-lactamase class C family)
LTAAYRKKEDVRLVKLTELGPAARNGKYFAGAGGLAGSAEDYLRFAQAMLNGGRLDGVRLVGRKTVESMTSNHIGNFPTWNDTLSGHRFGLGFRVHSDAGASGILGSEGSYGWGGAYGTYFFNDPKEQTVGILMIQLMPYAHLNIRQEFHNAVMQSIVD